MKQATASVITHPLARHDRRDVSRRPFPATDHHFRPETGAIVTRTRATRAASSPAEARSFQRMTAELLAAQNRRGPFELLGMMIVTALIAWSLVHLLIVAVQTANG